VPDGDGSVAVARALLEADTVTIRPDEPVTFSSGLRSPVYVDNRRLIFHPGPWRAVIDAFHDRLRERPLEVDVVAGVEAAGIPHSSALAFAAGLPSVFVRKLAREHGLARRIEGGDVSGRRVILVEDLVTTGSSSLSAVAALRDAGAIVSFCLAIISYGFGSMRTAFDAAGVTLQVLTTFETLVSEGVASGRLDARSADIVRAWLADPHAWAAS